MKYNQNLAVVNAKQEKLQAFIDGEHADANRKLEECQTQLAQFEADLLAKDEKIKAREKELADKNRQFEAEKAKNAML